MDGGGKMPASFYRVLLDRFESLEASHEKLKEQFQVVVHEKASSSAASGEEAASDSGRARRYPGWGDMPGTYFAESPYRRVLEYMGHALHVSKLGSSEIIYWNCTAEKLYGYKDYEAVGQRAVELIYNEDHRHLVMAITERVRSGECWSGQLPIRKRSGRSIIALVTKSPLYEDGELTGVVTVSSDAAVFNRTNTRNMRTHQDDATEQTKFSRINLKNIQWHQRPQIAAVPHLASSVSNLASKVLSRARGDVASDTCRSTRDSEEAEAESHDTRADRPPRTPITMGAFGLPIGRSRTEGMSLEKEETTSEVSRTSKIAVKILEKLHIGTNSKLDKVVDERIQQNGLEDNVMRKEAANGTCSLRYPMQSAFNICSLVDGNKAVDAMKGTSDVTERKHSNLHTNPFFDSESSSPEAFSGANQGCYDERGHADHLPRTHIQFDGNKSAANFQNTRSLNLEDASSGQSDSQKSPDSAESSGSSSSKGENDHLVISSAIRWEDLQLKEEIGQGSFAIVYRGIWKGSDVAVKVYTGNQYDEETLLDYKKEIDIMRRLRHPNVLLFMGASCTEERIAIVTEYMTRGSLYKALHRSSQQMDIRRRLRIALDVVRGMNYLHHRNPPIVHRDLKSSNLLVDKSWNVKQDLVEAQLRSLLEPPFNSQIQFSISLVAFLLHSSSDLSSVNSLQPQWMAPEVLRNELSTEKSDVYSFGVILWELVTVRIPWSDLNALQVVGVVGFMDRRLDIPNNIDPHIASIISECWRSNPEDRPSFKELIPKMANLVVQAGGGSLSRLASPP